MKQTRKIEFLGGDRIRETLVHADGSKVITVKKRGALFDKTLSVERVEAPKKHRWF